MHPISSKLVVGAHFDDMFCVYENCGSLYVLGVKKTVCINEDFDILLNFKDINFAMYQYYISFTYISDLEICPFSSKVFLDRLHVFILKFKI